jgi:hypothetical protein
LGCGGLWGRLRVRGRRPVCLSGVLMAGGAEGLERGSEAVVEVRGGVGSVGPYLYAREGGWAAGI